jgi:hypothetical protein
MRNLFGNRQVAWFPVKHPLGTKVIGIRCGDPDEGRVGELVRAFKSINGEWENPVYVIRYRDGRERKFGQVIFPNQRNRFDRI